MTEKPPLPPEENTGLANLYRALASAARTNPVTTALQVMEPKKVADATLEGNPELLKHLREYNKKLNTKDTELFNVFSQENSKAIGSNSLSTDTYSSVPINMNADKYFENVTIEKLTEKNINFLAEKLKVGEDVAQPAITLQWDGTTWKPLKGNHEGRHRVRAAQKVFGNDVKFSVNVNLRNKVGNKIPIEELKGTKKLYTVKSKEEAAEMLSELKKWSDVDSPITKIINKQGGGSVIMKNPYDYQPRAI
mgnify:CR=1 FL=1|tara:strand:- start:20 stop:769 length:750 start_codon:yes stop_codon:yes gene_type:complete